MEMTDGNHKHVLICVLDWGLGHATRCVPVIKCLLDKQLKISIAGNGASLDLLKKEFSGLSFYELPSYSVRYTSTGFFFINLFFQIPKILNAIRKEKLETEQLVKNIKADVIISDNRYGCYCEHVHSVFITHQLNIQLPLVISWAGFLVNFLHHFLIKNFDACWVPDQPQHVLTGKLTESKNLNTRFVGVLSRFNYKSVPVDENLIVGLVSGPEPQRTLFERKLITEFKTLHQPSVIVRGLPQAGHIQTQEGNLTLLTHLAGNELEELIAWAHVVVARSGYSTVMDLYALRKKQMILIPTPGQTEQEYLASELCRRKIAVTKKQEHFDIKVALKEVVKYSGFVNENGRINLLADAVDSLLTRVK